MTKGSHQLAGCSWCGVCHRHSVLLTSNSSPGQCDEALPVRYCCAGCLRVHLVLCCNLDCTQQRCTVLHDVEDVRVALLLGCQAGGDHLHALQQLHPALCLLHACGARIPMGWEQRSACKQCVECRHSELGANTKGLQQQQQNAGLCASRILCGSPTDVYCMQQCRSGWCFAGTHCFSWRGVCAVSSARSGGSSSKL